MVINPARAQRCRKVRFPGAWSADQYRVLCSLSKPKIGQFLDLTPFDARMGEVKARQVAMHREPCDLHLVVDRAHGALSALGLK
jgi:hypothetical protein